MLKNRLLSVFFISFIISTTLFAYDKQEIKSMQDLTKKQKTITQKLLKQVAEKDKNGIIQTKSTFDNKLTNLIAQDKKYGSSFKNIAKSLKRIQKNWNPVKATIEQNLTSATIDFTKMTKSLKSISQELDKMNGHFQSSIKKQSLSLDLSNLVNEIIDVQNRKGHVINLAGKQRMLSQKMTKESLLIVLNVNVKGNKKLLKESSTLYDKTLNGFINGDKDLELAPAKTKKVLDHLKVVKAEWDIFYKHIQTIVNSRKINNKALLYVVNNNEKMLKLSHKVVQLYKDDIDFDTLTDKTKSDIIDIAGRQRMLTQKMLKEKILISGGMEIERNKGKIRGSTMLFDRSLKGLLNGDDKFGIIGATNPKIREQLSKVLSMWEKIHHIYIKSEITDTELVKLISTNIPLLVEMNKAVQLITDTVDY